MKKLIALLAAMLLALTACGGGDDSEAKDNIAEALLDGAEEGSPFDDEAAECFADNVVDEVGVDKLQEYGVLTDELEVEEDIQETEMSEGDAEKAADAFVDCVDVDEFIGAALGGEDVPEAVADCLEENLSEDTFRDVMKAGFMGDEGAAQEAMGPAIECAMQGMQPDAP